MNTSGQKLNDSNDMLNQTAPLLRENKLGSETDIPKGTGGMDP